MLCLMRFCVLKSPSYLTDISLEYKHVRLLHWIYCVRQQHSNYKHIGLHAPHKQLLSRLRRVASLDCHSDSRLRACVEGVQLCSRDGYRPGEWIVRHARHGARGEFAARAQEVNVDDGARFAFGMLEVCRQAVVFNSILHCCLRRPIELFQPLMHGAGPLPWCIVIAVKRRRCELPSGPKEVEIDNSQWLALCNLEIFRVREKDFPVEVVELKDAGTDFSWEPKGERFAIVSSSDPNLGNPGPGITIKTDISFYQLDRTKNDFRLLYTLASRTSNTIRWSPRGRHVVLATVGSSTKSELEFWDLEFSSEERREGQTAEWGTGIQQLGSADHYGVTDVEWDPSGRYLATSASAWRHTLENGYAIWDFRGQELEKHILDRFKQFIWRPRPRTLLTKEQQRQIRRNLKEYSRAFDEEDATEESNVSAELIAHRKRLVDEWNAWRARCKRDIADEKHGGQRLERVGGEEAKEEIEEWIDEVVEQIEEVVVE